MSLQDEIEKLLQARQGQFERRDAEHALYHERQRQRFIPMRAVLEEIVSSIESDYIEARIDDSGATIEVGQRDTKRTESNRLEVELRAFIEPNHEVMFGASEGESLFRAAPGFRVSQTCYYQIPHTEVSENECVLSSEQEVAAILVKAIVERVAFYRHLASMGAKRG